MIEWEGVRYETQFLFLYKNGELDSRGHEIRRVKKIHLRIFKNHLRNVLNARGQNEK